VSDHDSTAAPATVILVPEHWPCKILNFLKPVMATDWSCPGNEWIGIDRRRLENLPALLKVLIITSRPKPQRGAWSSWCSPHKTGAAFHLRAASTVPGYPFSV